MKRKTVLMLVLGLVATSCLLSIASAKPKDSTNAKATCQATEKKKAVFQAKDKKVVVTPGSDVKFRCNGKNGVVISGFGVVGGGRGKNDDDDREIRHIRDCLAEVNMNIKQCELNKERILLGDPKDPKQCDKLIKEENARIIDLKHHRARLLFALQTIRNKQTAMEISGSGAVPAWARPNRELVKLQQTRQMLESISEVAFDPISAGMIGIGAINDEFSLSPKEAATELEAILKTTKSLGLRNAIRITLKDIYLKAGDKKKALSHMRAMIAENDEQMYDEEQSEHEEKNKE